LQKTLVPASTGHAEFGLDILTRSHSPSSRLYLFLLRRAYRRCQINIGIVRTLIHFVDERSQCSGIQATLQQLPSCK
jgi:hypothetical protein